MDRIRWGNVAGAVLLLCVVVVGGLLLLGVIRLPTQPPATSDAPEPTLPSAATVTGTRVPSATTSVLAAPTTSAAISAPTPGNVRDDRAFQSEVPVPESAGEFPLGTITIAFDKEFPPYAPVVLLYQERLAEKRGLGVHFVPFDIEDQNRISEARRAVLLQDGGFDVLLTTMNSFALWGGPDVGHVTAVVGESAGADKAIVQASSIGTFNDLAGKAFAYSDGSVSEYLLYYMLRVGGVPVDQVIRFGQENLNQAVRRYLSHQAHGVMGWTSSDMDAAAKRPDSRVLMTSEQFRVTTDVVVSGAKALQTKRQALQAFHDAWFEANKLVFEHPEQAAQAMATWSGRWTGVESLDDLNSALSEFAQATLADNSVVLSDSGLPLLQERYKEAQAIWLSGSRPVRRLLRDEELPDVFELSFVRQSALDATLTSTRPPVNPTFHLTARPQVAGLTPEQQSRLSTVAVLRVPEVRFEPGAAQLNDTARESIETAVIPVLRNTVGTYLRIDGSAAWPGGAGLNETDVNALAFERARAVQDYILKFGIPVQRLVLGTTLSTCRECASIDQAQRDDHVTFSLVTAL